jgi:hypothetical protein
MLITTWYVALPILLVLGLFFDQENQTRELTSQAWKQTPKLVPKLISQI